MQLVSTPAIVLQAFKYGDSSKIVRLATRDHGLQSAIAKGAARPKSPFGARLELLSQGTAQLYLKATRDLQTLSAFDLVAQHRDLARDLRRFAAASALAELVLRCAPTEPHPAVFDVLVEGLERLQRSSSVQLDPGELVALWRMVGVLGFTPVLGDCVRDGRQVPTGKVTFSIQDGGLLCEECARGVEGSVLGPTDIAVLRDIVAGEQDVPQQSPPTWAAHRRLLARFVRHHLAEARDLKALGFWEQHA